MLSFNRKCFPIQIYMDMSEEFKSGCHLHFKYFNIRILHFWTILIFEWICCYNYDDVVFLNGIVSKIVKPEVVDFKRTIRSKNVLTTSAINDLWRCRSNPGTVKYNCLLCPRPVKYNYKVIQCDVYDIWTQQVCSLLSLEKHTIV